MSLEIHNARQNSIITSEKPVVALDFDGVICHSAYEIGYTAWLCAKKFWPDEFSLPEIPQDFAKMFVAIRPYLEFGFEGIPALKLLKAGWQDQDFAEKFCSRTEDVLALLHLDKQELKADFSSKRDELIEKTPLVWLTLNSCYPESKTFLQNAIDRKADLFIITTKQERFVKQILEKEGIFLPDEAIYGMDAHLTKNQVLAILMNNFPGRRILFVEDRLATLQKTALCPDFPHDHLELYLASWGYVTQEHIRIGQSSPQLNVIHSLTDLI